MLKLVTFTGRERFYFRCLQRQTLHRDPALTYFCSFLNEIFNGFCTCYSFKLDSCRRIQRLCSPALTLRVSACFRVFVSGSADLPRGDSVESPDRKLLKQAQQGRCQSERPLWQRSVERLKGGDRCFHRDSQLLRAYFATGLEKNKKLSGLHDAKQWNAPLNEIGRELHPEKLIWNTDEETRPQRCAELALLLNLNNKRS